MEAKRDHIFISYATEQSALCDWLARRLAAEEYAVWCDRQKLLGGENWPNDIDEAINRRTFRMLALLSRASMNKPNPQGEWLKGFAVGRKIGVDDFVIPLNTEGLRPDEITWNLQPINYISFAPSWDEGLTGLLKKLSSLNAPRVLVDGRRIAVKSIVLESAVEEEPELLLSNCFEFKQIPRFIRKYTLASGKLSKSEQRILQTDWPCRTVASNRVLAFHEPPSTVRSHHRFSCVDEFSWQNTESVDGIDAQDLVVNLIHRCLDRLLQERGLRSYFFGNQSRQWYLPHGVLYKDRVSFTLPDGKRRWFKGVGRRTYLTARGREVYHYHLSPSFAVLRDAGAPLAVLLRNRVYLTDEGGTPLDGRSLNSRRKHLCRMWFNKEWCARTLGIAQLLADEDLHVRFGPAGEQQLVINAMPIALHAPRRVRDELLDEPDEILTAWHEDDE